MSEFEKIAEDLSGDDKDAWLKAIRNIAKLNSSDFDKLMEFEYEYDEEHDHDEVQDALEYACYNLKTAGERAVSPLIELIEKHSSSSFGRWLNCSILSLSKIGGGTAVTLLSKLLSDTQKKSWIRQRAAKALGDMRTDESIEILITYFQSKDEDERNLAVTGLFHNISHGSVHYQKIAEINADDERCSDQSNFLLLHLNREAGIHSDGSVPFSDNQSEVLEPEKEVFYDSNSGEFYYIDDDGEEIECDNLGRDLEYVYPPLHFKGWNPVTKNYFDKLNKDWATDPKFKELGSCFESFLIRAFKEYGLSRLSINKNRPNTQGGTYLYKRFVRIFPNGFKPNGIQVFIESFCEETQMDGNRRDPSDAMYNNIGFPIPKNSMGIFVGMSAISYFENGEKWGIEDSVTDFDVAREFFYEIEEKMDDAKTWALEFTGSSDDFVTVQDDRVQRIRIKLPDLSLDSNKWSECRINEALKGLASIFGDLFAEYSIE